MIVIWIIRRDIPKLHFFLIWVLFISPIDCIYETTKNGVYPNPFVDLLEVIDPNKQWLSNMSEGFDSIVIKIYLRICFRVNRTLFCQLIHVRAYYLPLTVLYYFI